MNYGKKHDLPFGIMDVAGLLRLNIRRRAPGQVYVDCPICGDRRGKMNLNTAKDLWRCNYCGEGGGMLSLYAKVYGVSNSDAYAAMEKQRKESLEAVLQLCGNLGAEIRYHPEYRYFTAMVWTGWDTPCGMGEALAIQQEIQRTAAQYPTVVCYCFDPFSTLVYTV